MNIQQKWWKIEGKLFKITLLITREAEISIKWRQKTDF